MTNYAKLAFDAVCSAFGIGGADMTDAERHNHVIEKMDDVKTLTDGLAAAKTAAEAAGLRLDALEPKIETAMAALEAKVAEVEAAAATLKASADALKAQADDAVARLALAETKSASLADELATLKAGGVQTRLSASTDPVPVIPAAGGGNPQVKTVEAPASLLALFGK